MAHFHNNALIGASGQGEVYEIEQSLRFDGSSHLSWTPGSAGNRRTSTFSVWFKPTTVGGESVLISATGYTKLAFDSGGLDHIWFQDYDGSVQFRLETSQSLRDPSAWYHLIGVVDTTNATASDRIRLYLNGERISAFGTNTQPSQNFDTDWSNTVEHKIGSDPNPFYFRGYMAECHFLDGTAVTDALDFGEYDNNGVWRPVEYTGSYGTNGFYLKFDSTAANGIGHDHSGNGNNFTASGFTTSGTGTDVMSDTPTNNFCTINPIGSDTKLTITNGNLDAASSSAGGYHRSLGSVSFGMDATVMAEATYTIGSFNTMSFGIQKVSATSAGFADDPYQGVSIDGLGRIWAYGSIQHTSSTMTNSTLTITFDGPNNTVKFYKSGTLVYTYSSVIDDTYVFNFYSADTSSHVANFGQRTFAHPQTGFSGVQTSVLDAPSIKDGSKHFNTVLYTGTGSSLAVTGVGFQPDLVWIKNRGRSSSSHVLVDAVRGATKTVSSNLTTAEVTTNGTDDFKSFDSDGFTVGPSSNYFVNSTSDTHVAWCWKAGGSTSSNTNGSITSTVSVNATAGFSIVSYTGTGSAATVGHGLGVAPSLIITKNRDSVKNWRVQHASLGATKYLSLNLSDTAGTASSVWNDTAPTSTVFSVANDGGSNENTDDIIAYCFAEVEGYSKFGSYTGNGSTNGTFVHCGFKPAWIMVKNTTTAQGWYISDNKRDTYNQVNRALFPANSDAESSATTGASYDFLSNGFKPRTSNNDSNGSSDVYVFMAFAENPFGGDGVSPATAR